MTWTETLSNANKRHLEDFLMKQFECFTLPDEILEWHLNTTFVLVLYFKIISYELRAETCFLPITWKHKETLMTSGLNLACQGIFFK